MTAGTVSTWVGRLCGLSHVSPWKFEAQQHDSAPMVDLSLPELPPFSLSPTSSSLPSSCLESVCTPCRWCRRKRGSTITVFLHHWPIHTQPPRTSPHLLESFTDSLLLSGSFTPVLEPHWPLLLGFAYVLPLNHFAGICSVPQENHVLLILSGSLSIPFTTNHSHLLQVALGDSWGQPGCYVLFSLP